jgi:TatD DNase family protein
MKTIIDTHAHLDEIPDVAPLLTACAQEGLSDIIALGVDLPSNKKHLEIRHLNIQVSSAQCPVAPRVHLAFGLHPGNITTSQETEACLDFIREHIDQAVAIGEVGLDYHYKWVRSDEGKKREQKDVFARQLALAREFDRPIVIHSRGAYQDALEMTLAVGIKKANFHWYTGPLDVLKGILDAGFLISVSPSLEYSPEARAVADYAPRDRILVETDTPVRGWTPKDVWRTLALLAGIKKTAQEEVLEMVNHSAKRFFSLSDGRF